MAQEAFLLLKKALIEVHAVVVPDFTKTFVIEIDAWDLGIGTVLIQDGHQISFMSKAFSTKTQAYSTYEKECLALVMAVEKWHPYLLS